MIFLFQLILPVAPNGLGRECQSGGEQRVVTVSAPYQSSTGEDGVRKTMILGGLIGVSVLVFFIRRSIPNWLRGFALLLVVLYDTAIWINMFPAMVNIAPSCAA